MTKYRLVVTELFNGEKSYMPQVGYLNGLIWIDALISGRSSEESAITFLKNTENKPGKKIIKVNIE